VGELAVGTRSALSHGKRLDLRDAAPALTGSLARSAAMFINGSFDAVDYDVSSEGLGQESNGSGLQRSGADAVIGEGRDKNKRRGVALGAHIGQKVQAAHSGHLHIRNDTRRVV
jgi:hypothetical protein